MGKLFFKQDSFIGKKTGYGGFNRFTKKLSKDFNPRHALILHLV